MDKMPAFKDMALTPEEKQEERDRYTISAPSPIYPPGLSISFDETQIEKLGLKDGCEPGDILVMTAMAKVTSVSKRDTDQGTKCRVEMQIEQIACDEGDEPPPARRIKLDKLYGEK